MNSHPFTLQNDANQFDLSHGFLPKTNPIRSLPKALHAWDELAYALPKVITNTNVRRLIHQLPDFDLAALTDPNDVERAMLVLSFLGHAYVWADPDHPAQVLPAKLSQPWHDVAVQLGRPPVLSYASYALYNWYAIDDSRPLELGNIALLQNFMGGVDEEWFILIHIDIELKATPALRALQPLQKAIADDDIEQAISYLNTIAEALTRVGDTLDRMEEHCDPYIYYHRVRPFINGWHQNPALPQGLLYEGVSAYHNQPQQFKGETGAQSSIIPCLDAVLNIAHENTPLKKHLDVMQDYMPHQHRAFLNYLQQPSHLREAIKETTRQSAAAKTAYNDCIEQINRFRQTHYRYAAQYINKQTQTKAFNPVEVGTGGTPFMPYLKKHQNETEHQLINEPS
jgi:indoleamine 2,3-dioxygenase